jgi:phospholipase/lecithinase/hemolysin
MKVLPALLVLVTAVAVQAQQYTKIVVFGDSLSDTGNDAVLSFLQFHVPIPGPAADYTLGRFTDGPDTLPPAMNYFGVWVEQLAAALPSHPMVVASLEGGTNYAFGFAKTGSGTTLLTFGPGDEFIYVENVGQQIDDYLATHPTIDNHTLFVVWAGANDVLQAGSAGDVVNGALDEVQDIQRLIHAGATQFLVPNLPPLGLVPRFNVSASGAATANEASALYNTTLDAGVSLLPLLNFGRHLTINRLNTFSLLKQIVASPAKFGLLNATTSSQGVLVDPDTYLFWDDLHPTTRGHNIVATDALELIEPAGCVIEVSPGEFVGRAAPGCR